MSEPIVLTVSFRTVTPLFLGGASPDDYAELRAPSIKGVLRFWHRAVNPRYLMIEPSLFGDADRQGQSKILLRWQEPACLQGRSPWRKQEYGGFSQGSGTRQKNGIQYLIPNGTKKLL